MFVKTSIVCHCPAPSEGFMRRVHDAYVCVSKYMFLWQQSSAQLLHWFPIPILIVCPSLVSMTMAQSHLPFEVFRHMMTFRDPIYELALEEGTPTALLIKDLKFVSIGDVNIVRPRQTGSLHFIKHCGVCPRASNYRLIWNAFVRLDQTNISYHVC